ncbi:ATP-dependent Clp protease ATP-binding subunit ClpX, partial [termite gut metagenome]
MKNSKTKESGKQCSFCGRHDNETELMITGLNGNICNSCVEQAYEITQEHLRTPDAGNGAKFQAINLKELPKPIEIKKFLDQYIIGQDNAKRFLAVSV